MTIPEWPVQIITTNGNICCSSGRTYPWALALQEHLNAQNTQDISFADLSSLAEGSKSDAVLVIGQAFTGAGQARPELDGCGTEDQGRPLMTIAQLFVLGKTLQWSQIYQNVHRPLLRLPVYPYCRQTYRFQKNNKEDSSFSEGADSPVMQYEDACDLISENQLLERLNQNSIYYIGQALSELGLPWKHNGTFDPQLLPLNLSEHPARQRLYRRLLFILNEKGYCGPPALPVTETLWQWHKAPPDTTCEMIRDEDNHHPAARLFNRCAPGLGGVLSGVVDPLTLVFPGGDSSDVTGVYRDMATARLFNRQVAHLVNELASQKMSVSDRAPVRILEIGAGTGSTTVSVLGQLADQELHYAFTDLGPRFVTQARTALPGKDNPKHTFTFTTLDISSDLEPQGFACDDYDIVIAVNVLHATDDITRCLSRINTLLNKSGHLVLVETIEKEPWLDLVFGLLDGWWCFTDQPLRKEHPLLMGKQWLNLLSQVGFVDSRFVSPSGTNTFQKLIVASCSDPLEISPETVLDHHRLNPAQGSPSLKNNRVVKIHEHMPSDRNQAARGMGGERTEITFSELDDLICQCLGWSDKHSLPARQSFREMGLDSLVATEIRSRLANRVGRNLPVNLLYDYPTLERLYDFLCGPEDSGQSQVQESPPLLVVQSDTRTNTRQSVAIIGMSCRYPGGVTNLNSFWQLLCEGKDAITLIPEQRLRILDSKVFSGIQGGFLNDIYKFDADFFSIAPREAQEMDPQFFVMMESVWRALENAGQTRNKLYGSDTGVWMGLYANGHQERMLRLPGEAVNGTNLINSEHSSIVGRLSYYLGLHGPNMPVNTACSSSLVAIHQACTGLLNHECDLAIAGGVSLIERPCHYAMLQQMNVLSPSFRCRTFSESADGFVPSEGCGVVVLKRLEDAERDNDTIWAVIRASAVNQDGHSLGPTTPNGEAQKRLLQRTLQKAGLSHSDIGYVEAHGTGTQIGDPMEARAIGEVYGQARNGRDRLWIGSVKSNIGHGEASAGVAGVIKTALSLHHGIIPASLHCQNLNPEIPWRELNLDVPRTAIPWSDQWGGYYRAGVSAFGISGTNAHLILENYRYD